MPVRINDLPLSKQRQVMDALDRGLTTVPATLLQIPASRKINYPKCEQYQSEAGNYGAIHSCQGETRQEAKHSSKKGWLELGGQRHYMRSAWERNFARLLEFQKQRGIIWGWAYEFKRFDFPVKRGNNSYLPDFLVTEKDGSQYWVEIKGFLTAGGRTKMKRFVKYYPDEKLVLIDAEQYRAIAKQCRNLIVNWE